MNCATHPDQALVLSAHGRQLRLRLADGREVLAHPPGRRLQLVCGDRVQVTFDANHDEWRVAGLIERRGCLWRSNQRGGAELLAANLDLLAVVIAPRPTPDPFMVDRYLAAAKCAGLEAVLVANKCELAQDPATGAALAEFARLGYRIVACSTRTRAGLPELAALLGGHTAMLVGQSGVGKSSLLRALVPASEAAVGELDRDLEGRHTTTATRWHDLPAGGALLDTPGVRDFAPAIDQLTAADLGFVDIGHIAGQCRFGDCRHWREPDCAVRAAAETGELAPRRLESFRRLWRLREQLRERSARQ